MLLCANLLNIMVAFLYNDNNEYKHGTWENKVSIFELYRNDLTCSWLNTYNRMMTKPKYMCVKYWNGRVAHGRCFL